VIDTFWEELQQKGAKRAGSATSTTAAVTTRLRNRRHKKTALEGRLFCAAQLEVGFADTLKAFDKSILIDDVVITQWRQHR